MNEMLMVVGLALFGAALGSFAAATVWRIRAAQLKADKDAGIDYSKKEYKHLKTLLGKKPTQDRSQCLHCHKKLAWYELIPVASWVTQKGRCRGCGAFIGWFEIIAEVGLALFFVLSYLLWQTPLSNPLGIAHFVLWLAAGVVMTILFAYDAKWFLLPDLVSIILIALGVAVTGVVATGSPDPVSVVVSALVSVAILGGLYGALYLVSRGRWVGLGDAILGVGLGLLLVKWELAFVALFMANLIGCLIVIPLMATGRLKRNAHIPFGPLLIAGAVVAWFFGAHIIDWYMSGLMF